MGERVSDGCCRLALAREGTQRRLHTDPKTVQEWPGASLAYRAAQLRRLAANLFLDSVQCSDARHRLGRRGRSMSQVDVIELAPGVGPARDLIDGTVAIEMMES